MTAVDRIIYSCIEYLIDKFDLSPSRINEGECMAFAENLYQLLVDGYNMEPLILCDATFIDYSGQENEYLWDISELCSPPANYSEIGLPCHYWIYINGKHYDSECPGGVESIFEIPIVKLGNYRK